LKREGTRRRNVEELNESLGGRKCECRGRKRIERMIYGRGERAAR